MKYKILGYLRQLGLLLLVAWTVVSLVTLLIEIVQAIRRQQFWVKTLRPNKLQILIKNTGLINRHFSFPTRAKKDLFGTAQIIVILTIGKVF